MRDGYGTAKFNSATQKIDWPSSVPKERLPSATAARARKGLMLLPVYGPHDNDEVHTTSCDNDLNGFSPDKGDVGPEISAGLKCLANKRTSAAVAV